MTVFSSFSKLKRGLVAQFLKSLNEVGNVFKTYLKTNLSD